MHELASSNLIWRNKVMVGYFVFNTFDVRMFLDLERH